MPISIASRPVANSAAVASLLPQADVGKSLTVHPAKNSPLSCMQ
jgi:hypothetical protein